jgi:hypothetical protein
VPTDPPPLYLPTHQALRDGEVRAALHALAMLGGPGSAHGTGAGTLLPPALTSLGLTWVRCWALDWLWLGGAWLVGQT